MTNPAAVAAGLRLLDLRTDRGLSLRKAAIEIGVKEWTLRSAEAGVHIPQPHNRLAIADFYGVAGSDIWPAAEQAVARETLE